MVDADVSDNREGPSSGAFRATFSLEGRRGTLQQTSATSLGPGFRRDDRTKKYQINPYTDDQLVSGIAARKASQSHSLSSSSTR